MNIKATSAVEEFEASIAQLDGADPAGLPLQVRSVLFGDTSRGWVVRVSNGSTRRVRLWWASSTVVSAADRLDASQVGNALVASGAAALAHVAGLWVPPESTGPEVRVPEQTLDQLVRSVRSGDIPVDVGVLGCASDDLRCVVVRTSGQLLAAKTTAADDVLDFSSAGLAGLWRTVVAMVGS